MREDKSTPRIDEAVIADALGSSIVTARAVISDLEEAGFLIMRRPRTDITAISEAVRTGNWTPVTEWDWKAWLAAVNAGFITKEAVMSQGEDAIAKLARTVPLTQEAVSAAVDELERAEMEPALGRVVVLDEAGERKVQDLLAGRSVPSGRLVEVTYRMPDGSVRTVRHAEFAKLDKVSYDPRKPTGALIEGAKVLSARATLKLAPGKRAEVHDRGDVEVLGVFWADGIISFSGDANRLTEFRNMAARVVGEPGARDAG